jgi:hypothetical protein
LGWSLGTESEAELAKRNERAEIAERAKTWNFLKRPHIAISSHSY